MKRFRKPPALRRGDAVGVVAPSSPVEQELLVRGARELEAIGYRVQFAKGILSRRGFFAGDHQHRAEELLRFLADQTVKAIFAARGGYGSNYVVELLGSRSTLQRLKRQPPKIVVGYSDVTSLLLFLNQMLDWVVFQGPMLSMAFAAGERGYDRPVMEQVLSNASAGLTLETGAVTLRPGSAEGRLVGGCLPMLTATLRTPQEIDTRGAILLLEDVDEKPFRIDRMLFQLRRAGKFRGIRGVIFGEMPGCSQFSTPLEALREIIQQAFQNLEIPIVFGLNFGHTTQKCLTLPLGVRARLTAEKKVQLSLLEPAVSVPSKVSRQRRKKA